MGELQDLLTELKESAKLLTKEVKKINTKGDLTPQELESLYKASCVAEKLMMLEGVDLEGMSGRRYDMNIRGNYGYQMHDDHMWDGYSETRGRSPATGRYISRGMDGMSGHSIEDRMIAALEDQMDQAKNEYERKMILDEIQRIRMGTR